MEFKNLREKVTAENRLMMQGDIDALYLTGEKDYIRSNLFASYLTNLMKMKFQKGEISLDVAIEKAKKSIIKSYDKRLEKTLSKIQAVENSKPSEGIMVSVEWKKSTTWGANPTASVRSRYDGFMYSDNATGTASGCGYDKLSASVADAFNQCPSIMAILYSRMEIELEKNITLDYAKQVFPYGSGYTLLPYFEGGVGIECFRTILEFCGYEWTNSGSGKMFDCYTITRKEGAK